MAYPTAVNDQITDCIQKHKETAQEVLDHIQSKDYKKAITILKDMIDPEFGLKPARKDK